MALSLGVAIPTYVKHVSFLQPLLNNIEQSTVKPEKISVSCSSVQVDRDVDFSVGSIPVTVQYTRQEYNPSQNRNRAASQLSTDLIMFIDGDDLMHPQRIELVKNVFLEHPEVEAVYHTYDHIKIEQRDNPYSTIQEAPEVILNEITSIPNWVGIRVRNTDSYNVHHAHVTVRKSVFDRIKFNESPRYKYMEDSLYASDLVNNGVNVAFLNSALTRYTMNTR
jgi:hypothetical protein